MPAAVPGSAETIGLPPGTSQLITAIPSVSTSNLNILIVWTPYTNSRMVAEPIPAATHKVAKPCFLLVPKK